MDVPKLKPWGWAFLGVLFYLALFLFNLRPVQALDIGWHIASGRYMWVHQMIPLTDPFSLTCRGARWVNSYWLTDIGLYGVVRIAGIAGLIVWKACMVLACIGLQDLRLRQEKIPALWRGAALLGLFLSAHPRGYGWSEQASLVTLFFLSLLVWHLEFVRQRGRNRLFNVWPLLFMLWANMHRGFVLGLIVAGCYSVLDTALSRNERRWRILWLGVCTVATLVTPYGTRLFWMIREDLLFSPVHIAGWARPPWEHLEGFWISMFLYWGVIIVQYRRRGAILLAPLVAALFLTVIAARHVANVPYAMLCVWPSLAVISWGWIKGSPWVSHWKRYEPQALGILGTVLLVIVIQMPVSGGINTHVLPVNACEFIDKKQISGPFYNDYGFGGYWLWRFGEQRPVFIDGRYPAVEGYQALLTEIETAKHGSPQDWDALLQRYHVENALIARPRRPEMVQQLLMYFPRPRWTLAYQDDVAVVFIRKTSAPR